MLCAFCGGGGFGRGWVGGGGGGGVCVCLCLWCCGASAVVVEGGWFLCGCVCMVCGLFVWCVCGWCVSWREKVGCKGNVSCTSYSRTFTIHKWLRQTAYILTHNMNNLEHIANNGTDTTKHTDVYNAQF